MRCLPSPTVPKTALLSDKLMGAWVYSPKFCPSLFLLFVLFFCFNSLRANTQTPKFAVPSSKLVAMAYPGRTSLCPRNYCPQGTSELTGRLVSFATKKEGKRGGKKSKADWLPPLFLERLGRAQGLQPTFQSVSRPPSPLHPQAAQRPKQDHCHPQPLSSRHRQGRSPRARPGRARPAISSPVIRSPPRSGLDSLL